jgi:hypothetical protein
MSVTISQLPPASTLTGAELVPVVQDSNTVRATVNAFAAFSSGLPTQTGHAGEYLTTDGTDASWSTLLIDSLDVGYLDVPQNIEDDDYIFALTDRGKHVYQSSTGIASSWLVPNNTDVDFPIGAAITLINDGAGAISVDGDTDVTLVQAGTGTEGTTATLIPFGMATLLQVDVDRWYVNGVGITVA